MTHNTAINTKKSLILLHGSRQTGDLLLGRIDKLRKRLAQRHITVVAPTGLFAHVENQEMRQWWKARNGDSNVYDGLVQEALPQLMQLWNELPDPPLGFLGFSQGARLAHLLTVLHHRQPEKYFPGLQCVILVAGYEAPMPDDLDALCPAANGLICNNNNNNNLITTPSLHVWGLTDRLISPAQSETVLSHYQNPATHIHEGGHHVPMRAANVNVYVDFIEQYATGSNYREIEKGTVHRETSDTAIPPVQPPQQQLDLTEPDEETKQMQLEEVEAIEAIFPDEFTFLSSRDKDNFSFPIVYQIALDRTDEGIWPLKPILLQVMYPSTYPQTTGPILTLVHQNNVFEFSTAQREACQACMTEQQEQGMPCVYACVAAAKEFFESGAMAQITTTSPTTRAMASNQISLSSTDNRKLIHEYENDDTLTDSTTASPAFANLVKPCPKERSKECNQQGLEIAASLLKHLGSVNFADPALLEEQDNNTNNITTTTTQLKGGSWMYTIGLVGKPSAGKSTFFNVATAFARQRNDTENLLGGATMAPHPFTTIDPNVGYCLVPAPWGLCPEDDYEGELKIGSTHGRDDKGRRLLPVLLKDVAGLVPGAYQGRGRGNKFLNDLTDADVLVHVLDASGTADVEGNNLGTEQDGNPHSAASHPLNDMEWIRTELIEWVYANLMYKWQSVSRKGRSKLLGMFSGYGQSQGLLWSILHAVESFMENHEHRDHALDHLDEWDEGDVRRVVSAFLGVRFPMAVALNKSDLPTSAQHISDIKQALPAHGAYTGTPLCAHQEMLFIRERLEKSLAGEGGCFQAKSNEKIPEGVWSCLSSAVSLHKPILVFPVTNFNNYAPLPGMTKYATGDPSLPSSGMVACLRSAGGTAPSLWEDETRQYVLNKENQISPLRDVLAMKPGSTVDDVFIALKNRRVLDGEFVRAEAAGKLGVPSRPVPKYQPLDASNRILKIMTTKKTAWQHNLR